MKHVYCPDCRQTRIIKGHGSRNKIRRCGLCSKEHRKKNTLDKYYQMGIEGAHSLSRRCPGCETTIKYSSIKKLYRAFKEDKQCHSCGAKSMWSKPDSKHGTLEMREKTSKSVSKLHDDKEYTAKVTKNWIEAAASKKVSEVELSIKYELLELGYHHSHKRKQQFIGPYIPDYVNYQTRSIIEVFGDYWHGNPEFYVGTDLLRFDDRTNKQIYMQDRWDYDCEKKKFYLDHDWNYFVLWENNIKRGNWKDILFLSMMM